MIVRYSFDKWTIFICRCLCLTLMFTVLSPMTSIAQPGVPLKDKDKIEDKDIDMESEQSYVNPRENSYIRALREYEENNYKQTEGMDIILTIEDIVESNKNSLPLKTGICGKNEKVLVWEDQDAWFEWQVDIPESGLYNIYVEYYCLGESSNIAQRELMIDGEVPFNEASNLPFYKLWMDAGEPALNNVGDEIRPKQIEVAKWQVSPMVDVSGMYTKPLEFYFSQGVHTIRLNYVQQPMAISKIIIKSPENIPEYQEVIDQYKEKGYKEATKSIRIEGEDAYIKNDPTVRREYDGNPSVYPPAGGNIRLNMIGGWRWRKGNQEVIWKFDVPESGLYKLTFRLAQWYGDGLPVYRQIKIDGKIPFKEMESYKFVYEHDWRTETLKDDNGEPYLFYLEEGEHTLSMTVKMGPLQEIINAVEEDAWILSDVIRDIIMITGSEPDLNFDYELDKKIPGLIDSFKELSQSMQQHIENVTAMSARRPMIVNNFAVLKDQLDKMIKDPFIIPRGLNDLMSSQSGLTLSLQDIQEQPLNVDYFIVASPTENIEDYKASAWQKLKATWQNFVASFYKDYDRIDNVYSAEEEDNGKPKKSINVWVSRGKEWGEVIKQKADEDFTTETDIRVNMNILPAGQMGASGVNALTLSIVSGKAPDIALGVDPLSPVELAIRDAAVDLSQFDDFDHVSKRFLPGVLVPFEYNEGIYALPETMDFNVLFYRKDIVEELGIRIPETWEELYRSVLPVLNQNGMQFYYPSLLAASSSFLPFLYQNGADFYTEDKMSSALDTSEAYKAFLEWTRLFKVYQIPIQANFFNRFRTGEMPMGVGNYSTYIMISVAAPELYGRWGIAPLPGVRTEDGRIDRTAGGSPSAAIVLGQSENKDEAWEFLKWWTDTDTQSQFGTDIESLIGIEARWNTANIDAFNSIPWNKKDLAVFEEQWKWYREQPIVLGGYFTDRHIKNAATSVLMSGMNERDALEKAIKDINKEMRNKQIEYGIIEDKR